MALLPQQVFIRLLFVAYFLLSVENDSDYEAPMPGDLLTESAHLLMQHWLQKVLRASAASDDNYLLLLCLMKWTEDLLLADTVSALRCHGPSIALLYQVPQAFFFMVYLRALKLLLLLETMYLESERATLLFCSHCLMRAPLGAVSSVLQNW